MVSVPQRRHDPMAAVSVTMLISSVWGEANDTTWRWRLMVLSDPRLCGG